MLLWPHFIGTIRLFAGTNLVLEPWTAKFLWVLRLLVARSLECGMTV